MRVVLLQRRPGPGQYSIEGYFERVVPALRALGVDCDHRVVPWRSEGLAARLRILAFAARRQGEVTHITGDITFTALATRPERTVLTVLDCEVLERARGVKLWLLRRFWYRLPARRAAVITVISQATKDRLLRHVPGLDPDKVHVVPVSVATAFAPAPARPMPEHPTVLQVGAKPNKNVPRLVEALAGLPCRLVLVGQPNAALAGQLAASGLEYEVHTEVPQAQMVEFYRQADAVAFASTHEGFGMPIVEAQSVGRPVVTADRSSMPEVAGEGACLVDPYDVASIRDAFVRIFADDDYRAALIARGFKNVTRFGTAAISRRYAELYGGLMEAAASPSRPAAGTS